LLVKQWRQVGMTNNLFSSPRKIFTSFRILFPEFHLKLIDLILKNNNAHKNTSRD
jgi:hypothetical protein